MKKIFLALLLAIATITPGYMMNSVSYILTRDIAVRDARLPQADKPVQPRNFAPTVSASYSDDMSLLEVSFNENVGRVVIYIINEMGQPVAKYSCDTQYEADVYMNVCLEEGYTLRIIGDDYEGEGMM